MGRRRRLGVSIICVFNDREVRRACLDRSIEAHRDEADVEYVPVDNVDGAFASAGAALNHGASWASHDYLVFAHQDVYLHSLRALERAAGVLADDQGIGVLGALGVRADGTMVGRIRDRVLLLGEPARRPTAVDSLDELLFMTPRRVLERQPLSEAPELAWHAYAVDYGLRLRSLGLGVCALDMPLTHNSLTVNLDRLEVAYAAIAATHPEALPVRTPGGLVTPTSHARRRSSVLSAQRWRYRWLLESVAAHRARLAAGGGPCVLGDIRRDVDELIAGELSSPLVVVNLDREPGFADECPGPLILRRDGRPVMLVSRAMPALVELVAKRATGTPVLLTNLGLADLRVLGRRLGGEPRLLGFRREIGFWMLLGSAAVAAPRRWRSPKSRPRRTPALAR